MFANQDKAFKVKTFTMCVVTTNNIYIKYILQLPKYMTDCNL